MFVIVETIFQRNSNEPNIRTWGKSTEKEDAIRKGWICVVLGYCCVVHLCIQEECLVREIGEEKKKRRKKERKRKRESNNQLKEKRGYE